MKDQQPFEENSSAQNQDYEIWVNSLGNIQDGVFQNTPITRHTIQTQQQQSFISQAPNPPINFNGSTPSIQHQMSTQGASPDINIDLFFNSPDRFYRDVINESPSVTKTPHSIYNNGGRTPLKNLNMSFSTPLFLRNIETSNTSTAGIKNFTPLKNQLFSNLNTTYVNPTQNLEIFQTPNDKSQNSILNSSPTTIKMNSSAVKEELNQSQKKDGLPENNKILPMSPTPASKIQQISPIVPISSTNADQISAPKMGYFKKNSPSKKKKSIKFPKQPIITTHALVNSKTNDNDNNTKFQIIMTDVNTFPTSQIIYKKRRKLTRSATLINTSTTSNNQNKNTKNGSVNKKQTLKRSISQPSPILVKSGDTKQSQLLMKNEGSSAESSQDNIQQIPLKEQTAHQRNKKGSQLQTKQVNQVQTSNNQSFMRVEDLFDERVLTDQENIKW